VSVLDFVFVIALLVAVIAAPFSIVGWSNSLSHPKGQRPFPLKSTLFFAVPVLIGVLAAATSTLIAQSQVAGFLESLSERYTISVEGRIVQNRDEVLAAVKAFADLPAHHSSPTRELHVDISDPPRHLQLALARDSSDPQEYWVFAPSPSKLAARASMKKDIGHIKTPVFDAY